MYCADVPAPEIAIVPALVMGEPVTLNAAGAVRATLVTASVKYPWSITHCSVATSPNPSITMVPSTIKSPVTSTSCVKLASPSIVVVPVILAVPAVGSENGPTDVVSLSTNIPPIEPSVNTPPNEFGPLYLLADVGSNSPSMKSLFKSTTSETSRAMAKNSPSTFSMFAVKRPPMNNQSYKLNVNRREMSCEKKNEPLYRRIGFACKPRASVTTNCKIFLYEPELPLRH